MLDSSYPWTWRALLPNPMVGPRAGLALLLVLLLVWSGSEAAASFDIVGVYHERVKRFEAVYYLEEDTQWHRDRRIFELFGNTDSVSTQGDEDTDSITLGAASWGMLLNVRPEDSSDAQLSFFSLQHRARFQFDEQLFEALHGAMTVSDYAELSLGSYWKEFQGEMSGSTFLELNSPRFFLKSSYVFGIPQGLERAKTAFSNSFDGTSASPTISGSSLTCSRSASPATTLVEIPISSPTWESSVCTHRRPPGSA